MRAEDGDKFNTAQIWPSCLKTNSNLNHFCVSSQLLSVKHYYSDTVPSLLRSLNNICFYYLHAFWYLYNFFFLIKLLLQQKKVEKNIIKLYIKNFKKNMSKIMYKIWGTHCQPTHLTSLVCRIILTKSRWTYIISF